MNDKKRYATIEQQAKTNVIGFKERYMNFIERVTVD